MFAFGILLNSLQLSELECPTEGGSFDPPGSDQRGLPQLGFVKLLPQLARIAAPYGPALERRTRYRSFRALREVRVEVRHPKCRPLHPPLTGTKSMGGWSQKGRPMEDTYIDEKCVDNPSGQRFFGWLRPRSAAELARVPVGPASVSVEDRPTPPASAPAPVMRL